MEVIAAKGRKDVQRNTTDSENETKTLGVSEKMT